MADERGKAIELAVSQIEKQFGKGSIMRLGSKEAVVPIAVISTGSISFDAALGGGGGPRGRVIEIFGPESSGKTTITLQIIAEAQKAGGLAAFVDAEHALDPAYAKKLGVDTDNLLGSQPDYGEQALEIGVMFGNPETTTGGKALKFYSSVRIDIRRIGAVKDGDVVVGSRTKTKIVKNKVAAPFRDAEFDILYGEGISREGDVLDLAVLHNIVDKSGAWYSYAGERIGQGRENVRNFLKENREVFARVDAEIRKKLGISGKNPDVDVPAVPVNGEAQAKEVIRSKK